MAPRVPPRRNGGLASHYAPVSAFAVTLVHGAGGAVAEGWAAPAHGPLPCAVELAAGACLVALARATRFSAAAAAAGQRFGWCGFRIGALEAAAALDDEVRLLCAASGETLVRWNAADILLGTPRAAPPSPEFLSLPEFRKALQRAAACEDASTVFPFAEHLHRTRGRSAMVVASYRWILRRIPAPAEADGFAAELSGFDAVARCFDVMLGSQEYLADPVPLAGPFDARFPFGLGVFGGTAGQEGSSAPPSPL